MNLFWFDIISIYKWFNITRANVKLFNSQLNKLKPATKNETGITLRLSANMIDNSYNKINFPHKSLLTFRPV